MSLDIIELIMDVEESFDIQISDERAGEIGTVGDLLDIVVELTGNREPSRDTCLTAATFYLLRRGLVADSEFVPKSIRPSSLVAATLPNVGRQQLWTALQHRLDLRLPKLARPRWLVVSLTVGIFTASLTCGLWAFGAWGAYSGAFATFASLAVISLTAARLTKPFARHPRPSFQTFRGLSLNVLAANYTTLCSRFNGWSPADPLDVLRSVVAQRVGVESESITKESHLVYDLGMD